MLPFLQVLCLVLIAVGMGLALAHALEFPGKLRLRREDYFAVQTIYYPGFAIGGMFGELGAILATIGLLAITPYGDSRFWFTLAALLCLALMHAVFWLVNQPVNKIWLRQQKLGKAGAAFFATNEKRARADENWTRLRARWEYGHIARAVLATGALILLGAGIVARD